jgi:hypothetical protein
VFLFPILTSIILSLLKPLSMKSFYLPLFLLILLSSCLGYKELPVEYDYSYRGNFKKYRTFEIMRPIGVSDTTMVNAIVEKSIVSRMKFLGYKQTETRPHLIIGFKMYSDSLRFNGYDQPDIEDWVKNQTEELSYDQHKLDLKTGTLLIQIRLARIRHNIIWQHKF